MNIDVARDSKSKSRFRGLRVVAKVRESAIVTSFHLEPEDSAGWRDFKPGQFLVFRIPAPNEKGYELRNYSVSSCPEAVGRYRISVKREASAGQGLPDGLGSCHLHDRIEVGDVLLAEGPRGDFVLDISSNRPVVLLSGGVGLTPMVSMLHVLASTTTRRVVFVHACDNGEVHALRDEVRALAGLRPGVTAHFCYRLPTSQDALAGHHHSEGVVSKALLQNLLPLDDYDFYLCGPPPFMQAVYGIIRDLGVSKQRIAYEFFGPATVLEPTDTAPSFAMPAAKAGTSSDAATVEFRRSGVTAVWDDASESLLAFAEEEGLSPEFSCRAGICSTCKSRLVAGEVDYFEEPLETLAEGEVLLCCARPRGSVVLDI